MRYSLCLSAIVAATTAAALPAVSQMGDGQIVQPTGMPVQQISDGQIQKPTGSPVQQISDGQIQAPTGSPVMQISDGQIQEPTGKPVMQISDGQVQAPTGSPVKQIPDGQVQAPTGSPVQQAPDGQVQNMPAGGSGSAASTSGSSMSSSGSAPPSGYGSYNPSGSAQMPFKFPLDNGFPNIMVPSAQLTAIEKQAHGTLPNGALPMKLSDASATTFQVIAFNEIFEVAYFTALLKNITSGAYNPPNKDYVVEAITAVQAQEELHALGANAILASAGRTPVQPCQYKFPVADFDSAIATASLFTDVVLGTLQSAATTFGTTGDQEVLGLLTSIVGQEGEQDGYYRSVGKKIPSALPFLTQSAGAFAFSALNQLFVVPGTCGNLDAIKVPILEPLTVMTPPTAADSDVMYSYPVDKSITSPDNLRLVLINQQNAPIVQELQNLKVSGNTVTFSAPFPYTNNTLNGLTIATVTNGPTSFANLTEVANAAVWGPGLIEVN